VAWVETLPSGKYQARYVDVNGRKRSAGTYTHKRMAERKAAAAEEDARKPGWRDPSARGRPWGEWVAEWWAMRDVEPGTLKRDLLSLERDLLPKWKNVPLADITRGEAKAWAVELKKKGLAPATVQKRLDLLSASLTAAVDHETLDYNPVRGVRVVQGQVDKRRYLTEAEAGTLLAQLRPPHVTAFDEAFTATLYGTGLRWGEVVGLQIPRIDLTRNIITVAESWDDKMRRLKEYPKDKEPHITPMAPWLAEVLKKVIGDRTSGFVFLKGGAHVIDYQNWRREVWTKAVARSGLGHVRLHDLRHTFASHALQNGASLEEVGKMLGHSSPQTTQRYAKLAEDYSERVRGSLPTDPRRENVGN
jgi:integrase